MTSLLCPLVSLFFFLLLLSVICSATVENATNCAAVGTLISSCTEFVNYGYPDPIPGSSCCDAMTVLGTYSDTSEKRTWLCNCFFHLINVYNSNAAAISTLSGFCGIVLGFTIDPNTDCDFEGSVDSTTTPMDPFLQITSVQSDFQFV